MNSSADDPTFPLEPSGQEFLASLDLIGRRLADFLDGRDSAPASLGRERLDASENAEALRLLYDSRWPDRPTSLDRLIEVLFDVAIPPGFDAAASGYLAFVPGGGLPDTALADLIADIVNRYVGIRRASPGLARIDETVLAWFRSLVGYGEGSGGYLAPGGSIANLTAIVNARHHRLGGRISLGTLYVSDQTHHSIAKAAIHAGLCPEHVRSIPSDSAGRMIEAALLDAIASDRAAGRIPFLLVSNAGTTNTGAFDDLTAAAEVARRERLDWHVDAAYGGFFLLTDRGRVRMAGIERADSITIDPHKSLFLPYGTGCLLVRDVQRLKRAFDLRGSYMPAESNDDGIDACDLSPEQTRAFRGLRIWLPLKRHGVEAFRRQLDEKLDLAVDAHERLTSTAAQEGLPLELHGPPQLTVVPFRLAPTDRDGIEADRLTERLGAFVNSAGPIVVSPTRIAGRAWLRMCILSFRTHRSTIDRAVELILDGARRWSSL